MLRFDTESDIRGHDPAGDMGHAAGHHHHQFGFCEFIQKRPDGQRGLGLSHEDARRDIQRFRPARPHDARHDPSGDADNQLHHADVVEQREKCRDEYDCGEHLKGERESHGGNFFADFAKDKFGANVGVAEQLVDVKTRGLKDVPSDFKSQDEEGKGHLQAQSPENGLQADRLAIRRKQIRETNHRGQSQQSGESSHTFSSFFSIFSPRAAANRFTLLESDGREAVFP